MSSKKEEAEEWVLEEIEAGVKRGMEEAGLKTRLQCRKRAHSEVKQKLGNDLQLFDQLLDQACQATMQLKRAVVQGNPKKSNHKLLFGLNLCVSLSVSVCPGAVFRPIRNLGATVQMAISTDVDVVTK